LIGTAKRGKTEVPKSGLKEYARKHYAGNHRNMLYAEELGRPAGSNSQIYYVLSRHGWRKVMPHSKHPNKASDGAIKASKKLTLR